MRIKVSVVHEERRKIYLQDGGFISGKASTKSGCLGSKAQNSRGVDFQP